GLGKFCDGAFGTSLEDAVLDGSADRLKDVPHNAKAPLESPAEVTRPVGLVEYAGADSSSRIHAETRA
ncbi:MAG: hypothetical protein ABSF29_08405, partial [Tepidisphaeraceae bacterium]